MSKTSTSAEHRDRLLRLSHLFNREGFVTQIYPGGDETPFDTLGVLVEAAGEKQVWRVELAYLPGLEAELGDVSLMQCFVVVADNVLPDYWDELRRLVVSVNTQLPVGAFGLLEAQQLVYFKQNALLPDNADAIAFRIVHELALLIGYLLTIFSTAFVAVAQGQLSARAAMADPKFASFYS
jgi:hypothetical protein